MAPDDVMLSVANDRLANELQANGHFVWQVPHLMETPARKVRQRVSSMARPEAG
jgi:hypothetical protein